MKAIVIHNFGNVDQIEIAPHFPEPEITNEYQVKVRQWFCSINPSDAKLRQGHMRFLTRYFFHFPKILGYDACGEIVGVGSKVRTLHIGDYVVGSAGIGGYADYLVNHEKEFCRLPENFSPALAACLPAAGLSAFQALEELQALYQKQKLENGVVLLINGSSGGVGSFAVFLAKHYFHFPTVWAICSASNSDYMAGLGADRVLDYHQENFPEAFLDEVGNCLILDLVGNTAFLEAGFRILDRKSFILSLAFPDGKIIANFKDVLRFIKFILATRWNYIFNRPTYRFMVLDYQVDKLRELLQFLDAHSELSQHIRIVTIQPEEVKCYHQEIESGHTVGKIVINFKKQRMQ
jgi:NADPH:quinone reductase-like Zn-dependent oxidoreductase